MINKLLAYALIVTRALAARDSFANERQRNSVNTITQIPLLLAKIRIIAMQMLSEL